MQVTRSRYEVDGRTVAMPCVVRDASAGTVTFEVDADRAAGLVPGAFDVVETAPGRCHLTLAVIDYRDNDLGAYHEVGVTLFVRPAGEPDADVGTYIHRLPVDQAFTCAAGRAIWGFPKTVEGIDFAYGPGSVTVGLVASGRDAFRLTLPRGGSDEMPQLPLVTYTVVDGHPCVTGFRQGGAGSQVVAGGEGVGLELGDGPVAAELSALGLPRPPVFTTWTERMQATFDAPRTL